MSRLIKTEDYEGDDRRNGNGVTKLVWTIMMSSCGVIFIGFMAWMTSMSAKISDVEAAVQSRNERISSLERSVETIDNRLDRIESKLDRVLSMRGIR